MACKNFISSMPCYGAIYMYNLSDESRVGEGRPDVVGAVEVLVGLELQVGGMLATARARCRRRQGPLLRGEQSASPDVILQVRKRVRLVLVVVVMVVGRHGGDLGHRAPLQERGESTAARGGRSG